MTTEPVHDRSVARRNGMRAGLGIPGVSIFATMVGFAAIAREAGFDLTMTMATTAFVWGMPGQVAMATLHMAGASVLVIFTAVALANMRMLLMTISGMEMMGLNRSNVAFWQKIMLMQVLAITTWVQIGMVEDRYSKEGLRHYFIGMASIIYTSGLAGTAVGYSLSSFLPEVVLVPVLVITPLYILMMVINARRILNRMAGVAGGAIVPMLFPLIGEWSILVGGLIGGTMVVVVRETRRRAG